MLQTFESVAISLSSWRRQEIIGLHSKGLKQLSGESFWAWAFAYGRSFIIIYLFVCDRSVQIFHISLAQPCQGSYWRAKTYPLFSWLSQFYTYIFSDLHLKYNLWLFFGFFKILSYDIPLSFLFGLLEFSVFFMNLTSGLSILFIFLKDQFLVSLTF